MFKWLADPIKKLVEAAARWIEKCIHKYEPSAWNDGLRGDEMKQGESEPRCNLVVPGALFGL